LRGRHNRYNQNVWRRCPVTALSRGDVVTCHGPPEFSTHSDFDS
jgi:hypothetical protein